MNNKFFLKLKKKAGKIHRQTTGECAYKFITKSLWKYNICFNRISEQNSSKINSKYKLFVISKLIKTYKAVYYGYKRFNSHQEYHQLAPLHHHHKKFSIINVSAAQH